MRLVAEDENLCTGKMLKSAANVEHGLKSCSSRAWQQHSMRLATCALRLQQAAFCVFRIATPLRWRILD